MLFPAPDVPQSAVVVLAGIVQDIYFAMPLLPPCIAYGNIAQDDCLAQLLGCARDCNRLAHSCSIDKESPDLDHRWRHMHPG